jgi:ribosomal protein S18 acetylase RimI-like enzyme
MDVSELSSAVQLVLGAADRYFDQLFGSRAVALKILSEWVMRPSSELWLGRIEWMRSERGEFVGGFAALGGKELKKARRADAIALVKMATPTEQTELLSRMTNLAGLFSQPSDEEFYLSKMGLFSHFRGKGLGRSLVGRYLETGQALGFRSFRLDVEGGNASALRCYRACGFRICDEHESRDGLLKYFSMRLDKEMSCR